ncbi:MAG: 1-acyl-sn-glycerol-3-phosphate acyltransferase [Spirochaetaceae bacterium]|jgi:1-acyl-sn-glycerol-3-phosphate acyltransferase|nr:1-acyl-sn-glycerol-3-phosphate acyltransferase [Spirochaetaceae bacterium]
MMKYAKRLLVFSILTIIAIAFVALALPLFLLCLFGLFNTVRVALHNIAGWWTAVIIKMSGAKVHVEGAGNIPKEGPLCFISNHSGIFDIVLCIRFITRPFGFIAKKELLLIPFLNLWIVFLGGLFLERKNPRKALKTLDKGAQRIKKGGAMIIFPEGSRSKGKGLLPFKSGAFKLAAESGAVIIPVAITGSYDVFEKTGFINPAEVWISFGKPISQEGIERRGVRQSLANASRVAIEKLLAEQAA